MTHYLDLVLLPDEEVPIFFIRNKIYTKLHKAIHDLKATDIGISFPELKPAKKDAIPSKVLGCVIRIHSNQDKLQALQNLNWLGGLSGYCKVSEILPVPDKVDGYQTVSRIRQNMTDAKLKKRVKYQRDTGVLATDEAVSIYSKQYKAKMFKTGLNNPYLELQSTSTNNKYRLYMQFGTPQKEAVTGEFNRFGLSKTATVPIF